MYFKPQDLLWTPAQLSLPSFSPQLLCQALRPGAGNREAAWPAPWLSRADRILESKAYRVSRLSGVGEGKFAVVLFASAFGLPELFAFLIITQVKHFLYVFFIFYLQNKNKITALQMSDVRGSNRAAAASQRGAWLEPLSAQGGVNVQNLCWSPWCVQR